MDKGSSVATIRQNWRSIIPHLLEPAKTFVNGEPSYICPFCSHGTHGDGLTFDPTNLGRLHCFGPCGWSGDIIDLYRKMKSCSFQDAIIELSKLVGLSFDVKERPSKRFYENCSDFIRSSQEAFSNSPAETYLQSRGISLETAQSVGAGYCANWRHPAVPESIPTTPRLIIPTSATSYLARDIRPDKTLSKAAKKYSKQKVGNTHIFCVEQEPFTAKKPIFVVEGEIDAISLMEIGRTAIALGSVSCINILLKELAEVPKPNSMFVVVLDNDAAGVKATQRLLEALCGQGLTAINGDYILDRYKDVNEVLVADRSGFEERVADAERRVEEIYRKSEASKDSKNPRSNTEIISVQNYIEEEYFDDISQFAKFKQRQTGFSNIDEIATFYPGLYAIGGISSLGKTTFVHQLADQLAARGEHVLYFPIEQSPMELVSKGISRFLYQHSPDSAATSIQIRSGFSSDSVTDAISAYKRQSTTLSIAKCNFTTTVIDIRDTVRGYTEMTGLVPTVIVDYLQALRSPDDRLIQREAIDLSLRTLKDLQSELSATIVVVSSLNRVNYMVPIGFESFKESGGIEYTCDVVWGIDLICMDDPIFDTQGHVKSKREIISKAKVAVPREVRLVCLKNRYGVSSYSVAFDYMPAYDTFIPKSNCQKAAPQKAQTIDRRSEQSLSEEERKKIFEIFGGSNIG